MFIRFIICNYETFNSFCTPCYSISNSSTYAYPIINEENTALLLYIRYRATSSEKTIFHPRPSCSEKKGTRAKKGATILYALTCCDRTIDSRIRQQFFKPTANNY